MCEGRGGGDVGTSRKVDEISRLARLERFAAGYRKPSAPLRPNAIWKSSIFALFPVLRLDVSWCGAVCLWSNVKLKIYLI